MSVVRMNEVPLSWMCFGTSEWIQIAPDVLKQNYDNLNNTTAVRMHLFPSILRESWMQSPTWSPPMRSVSKKLGGIWWLHRAYYQNPLFVPLAFPVCRRGISWTRNILFSALIRCGSNSSDSLKCLYKLALSASLLIKVSRKLIESLYTSEMSRILEWTSYFFSLKVESSNP